MRLGEVHPSTRSRGASEGGTTTRGGTASGGATSRGATSSEATGRRSTGRGEDGVLAANDVAPGVLPSATVLRAVRVRGEVEVAASGVEVAARGAEGSARVVLGCGRDRENERRTAAGVASRGRAMCGGRSLCGGRALE